MGTTESQRTKGKRSLLWMETLWEGANTTTREENRKEEVLTVLRELARESGGERGIREYVPWQPLW